LRVRLVLKLDYFVPPKGHQLVVVLVLFGAAGC
jgi:hypothetical protein